MTARQCDETAFAHARLLPARNKAAQIGLIHQVPLEPLLKSRKRVEQRGLDCFHRYQRHQADKRTHAHPHVSSARRMQHVVEKLVLLVPKPDAFATKIVHRGSDAEKVLKEFRRYTLVNWIFTREFDRDPQHVEAKHSHPACAIALLKTAAVRERLVAIEHANVIKPQETALEDIVALGIFAVHPPGETDEQLMEDRLQKCAIAAAALFSFDLINPPGSPPDHGRINIAKMPFVCGDLAIRMLVPLAHDEIELALRKLRID